MYLYLYHFHAHLRVHVNAYANDDGGSLWFLYLLVLATFMSGILRILMEIDVCFMEYSYRITYYYYCIIL